MRSKILFLLLLSIVLVHAEQTTMIYPPFQHSMGYTKANSAIAKLVLGRSVNFHRTTGICALKLVEKDDKSTNQDDAVLTIFGINNHQLVCNVGLNKLIIYGDKGRSERPDSLYYPTDVCSDKFGNIYITDTYNYRVLKLKYEGDSIRFMNKMGGFGFDSTSLNLPAMVDFDSKKNVYITDKGNDRIVVTDSLLNTFKILEGIKKPHGIAVIDPDKGWCNAKKNKFIVVSSDRDKLLALSMSGDTLKEFFSSNINSYEAVDFNYIDYDYNGNIWVTDTINSCVHKFDNTLNYIVSFGKEGHGKREFYKPQGITIYRKFGQVFIAEKTGFQYYWIGVDGWIESLNPSVIEDTTQGVTISIYNTEQCKAQIEIIYNGNIIRTLTKYLKREVGLNHILWDLEDDKGEPAAGKGKYRIKVTLSPMYSSRGYFVKEFYSDIEKL